MTEPEDARVRLALRATIADRVAGLGPPAGDVYEQVRRRHRRSRRRTVAVAAAVTALAAGGLPLAVSRLDTASPPAATPSPTATSTAAATPARPGTRGSLAGDRALIEEAVRLLIAGEGGDRIDPNTVRVPYAEQHDGDRVVVAVGTDTSRGVVHSMVATSAPGEPLRANGGSSGTPQPGLDARLGQQYTAPEHLLTRFTIGDRSFGL